jgi:hypothetical protein
MVRLYHASISGRDELPRLLNTCKLLGQAVEVGTHRADFARGFMDQWQGEKLHCVDPYSIPEGYETQHKTLWGSGDRNEDFEVAKEALKAHNDRVEFHRTTSVKAVEKFTDDSLSFLYLDGDHRRVMLQMDLATWFPKLERGGILAGHDIICPEEYPEHDWSGEIQPAVFSFAESFGLDVYLIPEQTRLPWSYYLRKA